MCFHPIDDVPSRILLCVVGTGTLKQSGWLTQSVQGRSSPNRVGVVDDTYKTMNAGPRVACIS